MMYSTYINNRRNTAKYIIEHREMISPDAIIRFSTQYEEEIREERRKRA